MAEKKDSKTEEKNSSKPSSSKNSNKQPNPKNSNNRTIINLLVIIFVAGLLVASLFVAQRFEVETEDPNSFSDLISAVRRGEVSKIELAPDRSTFNVELYEDPTEPNREQVTSEEFPNILSGTSSVPESLKASIGEDDFEFGSGEGEVIYDELPKPFYVQLFENGTFWYILLIILTLGVALFFIRRIADTNNRAISFGNSRARSFDESMSEEKVTFADVAGNEEAKQELNEVIDFLKRPEQYQKMGARIPRGVLLIGSPGNGKTLMAKAVAGEAKVPFFYVSGSEFVEMFVGVGAGRVRDLFKRAKKKAPCVIFIDEIDAVGRQRGAGLGGGNDEREQTLNQILVELDGFEENASVIVIGATNRPDVLDPALLRPGRFDRQVTVTGPDRKEREKILDVHSKNKKFAKDVDLGIIAKRTPGFSGADLMNVLNEAAILTVRERQKEISNDTLREAIEKVALGPSLKTKLITEKQKKLTAYHEAGHALVSTLLEKAQKVQKVTIIPRGRAAGYNLHTGNDDDALNRTREQFLSEITVLFGGYTVEEIVFGDISTGASNDLAKASEIARNMVKKYGMSSLGPISFDDDHGMTFLGRDMVEKQHYSEELAKQIDLEVSKILDMCHKACQMLVKKYQKHLELIAETLIEKEVLEYEEFTELVQDIQSIETIK
jgi:cell division protease FtsH